MGSVRDIGILDGALLNCHVMFKLETGWTHMATQQGKHPNLTIEFVICLVLFDLSRIFFFTVESMAMAKMLAFLLGVFCAPSEPNSCTKNVGYTCALN